MSDWRTTPRTGRSQFIPLMGEVKKRLSQGETIRQIHDALSTDDGCNIGCRQFERYVHKYFPEIMTARRGNGTLSSVDIDPGASNTNINLNIPPAETKNAPQPPQEKPHPWAHLAKSTGDRRRNDFVYDPTPDLTKIFPED